MNEMSDTGHDEVEDEAGDEVVTDAKLEQEEAHVAPADPADDAVHAQAEEQPQPEATVVDDDAVDPDVDTADESVLPEGLRDALGDMRSEADRIAALGTGEEQVEAAERFAEGAGRLDEQIGSAARAADDDTSA